MAEKTLTQKLKKRAEGKGFTGSKKEAYVSGSKKGFAQKREKSRGK